MAAESIPMQERNGLWHEVFQAWTLMLTRPSLNSLEQHAANASLKKTVLGIGFLGLITALWTLIPEVHLIPFNIQNPGLEFLSTILLVEIAFFAFSGIVYLIAQAFGGKGNFIRNSYLLSLVAVPLGPFALGFIFFCQRVGISLSSLLNPFNGLNLALILTVLFTFYALLVLLLALRAALQLSSQGALYTLGSTVGFLGVFRSFALGPTFQENIIVGLFEFMIQQWQRGRLQESILGHFWLIFFAVAVAVIIGVIIGILISLSPQRPNLTHVFFLIPVGIFFLLWAFSSGLFGEQLAAQITDTVNQWQRAIRGTEGFFGPLLSILGAIVRKPAAIGFLGMAITLIFYVLLLVGERASDLTLYIAGIILTIPSIAMFGILIEPLGIGGFNAAFALVLYAQLPILRNTYTGIREVEPEIVEAGRGMGMTEFQLLRQVRFPMAVPVIFTGVRVSIVMLVGIAAIAAYIGVDTLGDYIFSGIQRAQELRYLTGAMVVAVLALVIDYVLEKIEAWVTPEGLKGRQAGGRQAA